MRLQVRLGMFVHVKAASVAKGSQAKTVMQVQIGTI